MNTQLKPCPFCYEVRVSTEPMFEKEEVISYTVICSNCGANGPVLDVIDWDESAAPLAVEQWNNAIREVILCATANQK